MAEKLYAPKIPRPSNKIIDIDPEFVNDKIRPSISFTFLDVSKDYGLKYLAKQATKHTDRDIYKELDNFLKKARQYNNITELVSNHASHIKAKATDNKTEKKAAEIRKSYKIDTCNIVHIHTNGGGNGPFVLHGFVINNCFEVVFIDPLHEIHKEK